MTFRYYYNNSVLPPEETSAEQLTLHATVTQWT